MLTLQKCVINIIFQFLNDQEVWKVNSKYREQKFDVNI